MANLPSFSPFSVHADEQSAGPRWRKWVDRCENLLCALDINDDRKKEAVVDLVPMPIWNDSHLV